MYYPSFSYAAGAALTCSLITVLLPTQVNAQALTRAQVEAVRNRVELIPQGRGARLARVSDIMGIGDALRTAPSAQAELRFNDGSLARIGERATFRFVPNTRNFRLSNGTVLLLVPPGRGRTNIQTPNAVTGIQGSALCVRYDPNTDTTFVCALTDSDAGPMVVSNRDGSELLPLNGGEMAIIQGDHIVGHYRFSLDEFMQTSSLVQGLDLFTPPSLTEPNADGLDGVRAEASYTLSNQRPVEGAEAIILDPDFVRLSGDPEFASGDGSAGGSGLTTAGDAVTFAVIPENPFAGLRPVPTAVSSLTGNQPANRSDIPPDLLDDGVSSSVSQPTSPPRPNSSSLHNNRPNPTTPNQIVTPVPPSPTFTPPTTAVAPVPTTPAAPSTGMGVAPIVVTPAPTVPPTATGAAPIVVTPTPTVPPTATIVTPTVTPPLNNRPVTVTPGGNNNLVDPINNAVDPGNNLVNIVNNQVDPDSQPSTMP